MKRTSEDKATAPDPETRPTKKPRLDTGPSGSFICMVIFTDSDAWTQWYRGTLDSTKPGHRNFCNELCTLIREVDGDPEEDVSQQIVDSLDYLSGNWEGQVKEQPCRPATFLDNYYEYLATDPTYCGKWESLNSDESINQIYLGIVHMTIRRKFEGSINGLRRSQDERCGRPEMDTWAIYQPDENFVVDVDFPEVPDDLSTYLALVS